ncbi:MAG: molybdate ABC transporter substrate-binding protein [Velocimicrobium sp.]
MKKRVFVVMMAAVMGMILMTGCKSKDVNEASSENEKQVETQEPEDSEAVADTPEQEENTDTDLSGHSLMIYCGAGMTEPFQKIADEFMQETKCEVNVTYANASQIQSQITTSEEGDMFIAGSQDEVDRVKDYVVDQKALVKHIPVLVVAKENPKEINGLSDLTKDGVTFIMGDTESTPIGKIAKKALTEAGIFDSIDIEATTTTAPQLATAIAASEADAAIVWKENCKDDGIEIVDTTDLDASIKTIPAVTLNCSDDTETLGKFYEYLDTDAAKEIWISFGYEIAE